MPIDLIPRSVIINKKGRGWFKVAKKKKVAKRKTTKRKAAKRKASKKKKR